MTENDSRYEIRTTGVYGFQWRAAGELGRMVKSAGRKDVTLWCFGWQVEERIKSDNEKRKILKEAVGVREAWREVLKREGRRVGNWAKEAGNSEEDVRNKRRDCTWGEIQKCKIAEVDY